MGEPEAPTKEEIEKELEKEGRIQDILHQTRTNGNLLIAITSLYALLIVIIVIVSIIGYYKSNQMKQDIVTRMGTVTSQFTSGVLPSFLNQLKKFFLNKKP